MFYRRHPWILGYRFTALPAGPKQLLWFDRGLAALEDTHLPAGEKTGSMLLLGMYVRAQAAPGLDHFRPAQAAEEAGASRARGASCRPG